MTDWHSQLVNASLMADDLEKIEFKADMMGDPVKAQQYSQDRQAKAAEETLQIKRGSFQKAHYDMGRYMDMDHHARYYDIRNSDLNRAQNTIVNIAEANTGTMKLDLDNTRRQFLVNEWYAQNKLDSLFFLHVAFLAMISCLLVLMLSKTGVLPLLVGKYIIFIITAVAAITALYRFNYTKYTRDVRYWNKRKFSDSPGKLSKDMNCKDVEDLAAQAKETAQQIVDDPTSLGTMIYSQIMSKPTVGPTGPPPSGPPS
jgi:hypothetical protein